MALPALEKKSINWWRSSGKGKWCVAVFIRAPALRPRAAVSELCTAVALARKAQSVVCKSFISYGWERWHRSIAFYTSAAFLKKTCKKGEEEQQQFCAVCSWWCISVKYLFSASSEHSAFYNGCRWTELCFLSKYTQSHLFMRICFKENSYWRKGSIWYSRRSRKRDQENLCRVPL